MLQDHVLQRTLLGGHSVAEDDFHPLYDAKAFTVYRMLGSRWLDVDEVVEVLWERRVRAAAASQVKRLNV